MCGSLKRLWLFSYCLEYQQQTGNQPLRSFDSLSETVSAQERGLSWREGPTQRRLCPEFWLVLEGFLYMKECLRALAEGQGFGTAQIWSCLSQPGLWSIWSCPWLLFKHLGHSHCMKWHSTDLRPRIRSPQALLLCRHQSLISKAGQQCPNLQSQNSLHRCWMRLRLRPLHVRKAYTWLFPSSSPKSSLWHPAKCLWGSFQKDES